MKEIHSLQKARGRSTMIPLSRLLMTPSGRSNDWAPFASLRQIGDHERQGGRQTEAARDETADQGGCGPPAPRHELKGNPGQGRRGQETLAAGNVAMNWWGMSSQSPRPTVHSVSALDGWSI